jgi:hypothetical protein
MPDRKEIFDISCPALQSAPLEIALPFKPGKPVSVTIIIPDGHAGLTGIALGFGHTAVIPNTRGGYISGNDERIVHDMSTEIPGPQWAAFCVNADRQAHVWEIRFELDEIGSTNLATGKLPIPVATIMSAR